jgi:hypothetical protein
LTAANRHLIRKGLRTGEFDQSLFDAIIGVEYESKASHAKKHFLPDAATKHISVICCNENDWTSAPVEVWCLQDFLVVQRPRASLSTKLPEHAIVDDGNHDALSSAIESDAQRFVLLAFLSPQSQPIPTGERKLHASTIKHLANLIAVRNLRDPIKDIGGVLTGFTQPGSKRDMGLLRKGEKTIASGTRGRNYYLAATFYPWLRSLAENANLRLPEDWLTPIP